MISKLKVKSLRFPLQSMTANVILLSQFMQREIEFELMCWQMEERGKKSRFANLHENIPQSIMFSDK